MSDPDRIEGRGVTRRALFRTAGVAAATGAILGKMPAFAGEDAPKAPAVRTQGPGPVTITLLVNGRKREISVEPRRTLLDALRTNIDLTGTKSVCDRGTCGACTVFLDGAPVYACTLLAVECEGRAITTVEGLGTPEKPSAVQNAFWREDAMQCGFCTPGFVMSTTWAVNTYGKDLTAEQVKAATAGNICRCGTYPHVVRAALAAAKGKA
jgi:aerobic-type carbon monoxide dehydrogenase small subunit (CoxS/CutS family)